MATTIKLKNSVTTTAAPSTLVQGEAAVNITDKKIWVGDASSSPVQIIGAGAPVSGTTGTFTGNVSVAGTFAANGGVTLGDASGDALTINSSAVSIPNGLNFDSNTLVIDATNNRVGIGQASPSTSLQITKGSGSTLRVNSTGANQIFAQVDNTTNTTEWGVLAAGEAYISSNGAYSQLFYTNGSERMRISSAGNVLIGNTSYAYRLSAARQSDGIVGYFRRDGATINPALTISANETGNTVGFGTDYAGATSPAMTFSAGAEWMRITSAGNVGIGTSSPTQKLSVQRTGSGDAITWASSTGKTAYAYADGSGIGIFSGASVTNTGFYANDTSNYFAVYTSSSEKLRLDSSGNLGLGVTPSAGGTYKVLQLGSAGVFGVQGTIGNFAANAYLAGAGTWTYATTGVATLAQQDAGAHKWYTAASGTAGNAITFTQAMTLDASGRLGIGTTSPATPAHIQNASGNTYYRSQNNLAVVDVGVDSAGTAIFYNNNNYPMTFGTNGSERMRIDSSGNLLVGTTVTPSSSSSGCSIEDGAMRTSFGSYTGNGTHIYFINGNGTVGTINSSGTTTSYNTSSDYRLKDNIAPMTGALATVSALKPVTYTWKADGSAGQGFIAHELQAVVPDCVTGEKDAVDADGKPVYQGIDTSFLVATLTKAIQELNDKVTALEAQLNK